MSTCYTFILFFPVSLPSQETDTHLTDLVQKSKSESNVLQNPKVRHKPRPPGRDGGSGDRRAASCFRSRARLHINLESPSPHLTPGQQIQMSPSLQLGSQEEASLSLTQSSSGTVRYSPTHSRVSSFNTSWNNL